MSTQNYSLPSEIAEINIQTAIKKSKISVMNTIILGILAGAFISFGAEGSNMATFGLLSKGETFGLGKVLAGALFGTGLMMVIIAGGELFTGNILMISGVLDRKIKLSAMLKNWFLVYFSNFIGALLIAYMIVETGLFNSGANALGGMTIKIAAGKVGLTFTQAFYLGIMCNWLVCIAVWMAYSAKDIVGKISAVFFPICLFVTSGFEHSVANMYYIPAGIMAKGNGAWVNAAVKLGVTPEKLESLTWGSFISKNLVPVTIGNIVGGAIFVGVVYWFIHIRSSKKKETTNVNDIKKVVGA